MTVRRSAAPPGSTRGDHLAPVRPVHPMHPVHPVRPGSTAARAVAALCVAAPLVLAGCAAQPPGRPPAQPTVVHHGLFVEYESVDELLAAADAVVAGTIVGERSELVVLPPPEYSGSDPETNPTLGAEPATDGEPPAYPDLPPHGEPTALVYTVYDVEVSDAAQGPLSPGDTVEVRLVGGELDGVLHVWDGVEHPEVGEEYAFFLTDVTGDRAEALNPTQSLFRERPDGAFEAVTRTAPRARELASEVGLALD